MISQRRSRSESKSEKLVKSRLGCSSKDGIRMIKPDACSPNAHGIMSLDHIDFKWPLPTMFGSESYAFSLINIVEDRFQNEVEEMSRNLSKLLSRQQIFENDWRTAYKKFLVAESRRYNLHAGVQQQSIDEADKELESTKTCLLQLQRKRDDVQGDINRLWNRCKEIKSTITKEKSLENLRQSLNEQVRRKYPRGDHFWKTEFNVRMSASISTRA